MVILRKRWLFWVTTAAIIGLGLCLIVITTQHRRSGITQENFDRIKEGMTEAEVEKILGGPPGTYTDRPIVVLMSGVMFRSWWIGDEGVIMIEVTFDEPRRVNRKEFDPIPPESFLERFRRRSSRLFVCTAPGCCCTWPLHIPVANPKPPS